MARRTSSGTFEDCCREEIDIKTFTLNYTRPSVLFSSHLETIYPALLRTVDLEYQRERISTPDGDFLDLDWVKQGSKKLVIISHGLEGNSHRAYMKGMASVFSKKRFRRPRVEFQGMQFRNESAPPFLP